MYIDIHTYIYKYYTKLFKRSFNHYSERAIREHLERKKRPLDHITASDHFCAAVVQFPSSIANMPSFVDYIEEVCPKRLATSDDDDEEMEEDDEGGGEKVKGSDGVSSES